MLYKKICNSSIFSFSNYFYAMQTTRTSYREEGSCQHSIPKFPTSFSKKLKKQTFFISFSSRAFGIPNNPFLTRRWDMWAQHRPKCLLKAQMIPQQCSPHQIFLNRPQKSTSVLSLVGFGIEPTTKGPTCQVNSTCRSLYLRKVGHASSISFFSFLLIFVFWLKMY